MKLSAAQLVSQIYVGYFNRAPDAAGLNYWVGRYNAGMKLADIAQSFSVQTESTSTYAYLANPNVASVSTFLTSVYANLFNRAPDAAGLAYWTGEINAGRSNVGNAIINIISGAVDTPASGSTAATLDASTLANKMAAGLSWAQTMSNIAGAVYGVNEAASAKSIVASVTSDAATVTAAATSTASFFANGGAAAPGQTFTLTTGVDAGAAFVGGPGADTFNAPFTTAATFTSLDVIDGVAGNDTLNVTATSAYTQPVGVTVKNVETLNFALAAGGTVNATAAAGFTGETALNVSSAAGALTITSDPGVATTATNARPGGAATTVNGGSAVSVTVSAAGAATAAAGTSLDTVVVGTTTAPSGAVTVSVANTLAQGGAGATTTAGTITVKGGTTVAVSESLVSSGTAGLKANVGDVTQGAVTVTGTAATTSVSVSQTKAVTGADAVTAAANSKNAAAATYGIVVANVDIADAAAADSITATAATAAGTITSVTLANYATASVSSAALNSVSLSGGGTTLNMLEAGSTSATNTTLALNLGGGTFSTVEDKSAQFKTVNAALTASTTVTSFNDSAARTLNLSGTGVLTTTFNNGNTPWTAINLAGAAGLKGDVSGLVGVTSIDASSTTGAMTLTLNGTAQSFKGGAGVDVIALGADATKTITFGSATTDQLILTANGSTYTSANTGKNVTGYEQLGINVSTAAATLAYDMSKFASGVNAIEVVSIDATGATTATFSKVVAGTKLQIDAATGYVGNSIVYQTADTAGATDSVYVNLKGTGTSGTVGYTTNGLTLQDANAVGIGSVTINSDASVFQGLHTLTTLVDPGLTNLAITGTGSLTITNQTNASTSLAISDNGTGTSATADGIGSLTSTGNVLGNLSYSGTHAFTIGALADSVANLTISNANTGTTGVLTVSHSADTALVGLTLNGSVAYTLAASNTAANAVTVNGATDNQKVSLDFTGSSGVHTITLGNGANTVVVGSGADVITLGTGANKVTGGAGADTVTFGTHTGVDLINLKAVATAASATVGTDSGADSGVFAVPASNSISTTTFDVVSGMKAGDTVQLTAASYSGAPAAALGLIANGAAFTTLNGVTLSDNAVEMVRGTYDSVGKTFVGSATGTDSLMVYDSNATVGKNGYEAVVLVGYVQNTVTGIGGAQGLVTLS